MRETLDNNRLQFSLKIKIEKEVNENIKSCNIIKGYIESLISLIKYFFVVLINMNLVTLSNLALTTYLAIIIRRKF